ncbi:uncharacterized protein [Dysidea avara]|uniref:uncharacterized protein n=1 Tax=Dysidea avara TaxID=196820 RepID=UPI003320538C
MEEPARLRTSRKAYRAHVTRILNKVDDTLANDLDELALTYLRTAITQLEKKKEQITALDQRIIDLIQNPDELEIAILDAEELQDLIMEKINELNQRVEMQSRPTHVVPAVSSSGKVTQEAIHENVSNTNNTPQSINTIINDTPAVSAASDTVATTSLTLESTISSTPPVVTSLESIPHPISVTSVSHPLVSHVHNAGPPLLIPANMTQHEPLSTSAYSSLPLPPLSTLNFGSSTSSTAATVPVVTSRVNPDLMGVRTTITAVDHRDHSQQFAASRLPKLTLPTFSGNPLAWLTFWDSFQAAIHLNPNLSGVQKFNYLKAQLQGDAARTIDGIPLCDQNYLHAVTLLQNRFGQTHKLVSAHMQALLQVPNPTNTLSSLRTFHDTIESHSRGLSSLGKSEQSYGDLLVPIILGKLPKDIKQNLARNSTSTEWKFSQLMLAILREIEILETGNANPHSSPFTAAFMVNSKPPRSTKPQDKGPPACVFCKGPHTANQCTTTDHHRRLDIVKQNNLCFNCLGKHKVSTCSSKHRCRKCHRKHHTSLCTEVITAKKEENTETTPVAKTTSVTKEGSFSTVVSQPVTTSLHLASNQTCLLKTAVATISTGGVCVESNILFDEGSQRSFLAKGLADCLQVQPHDTVELSLSTFGTGTSRTGKFDVATINLHSISGHLIPLTVLIVPTIAAPIHTVNQKSIANLPYLNGLRLAHPISSGEQFYITLLIGADQYWKIVEDHVIRGNGPTAVGSKLGYLLSGPLDTAASGQLVTNAFHVATQPTATPDLEQFWNVESVGISPKDESPNNFLDSYITNSVERLNDGSYCARFPWKDSHPPLPTNFSTSAHRTRSLARKLALNPSLLTKYSDILTDQERRGFIERMTDPTSTTRCHYIPHHAVRKDSSTTPVRIVYDCSCHQTRNQPSLNDCLLTGQPKLNDLCCIILRFRLHPVGICTDIEKAFLHIQLHKDDRDWTRFLWLSDPQDPDSEFVTYRFRVVLFGAVCSPFMLNAVLHCHLTQYKSPTAENMLDDLYVDNIVSGCPTESEAISFYNKARSIMNDAHLNLRSWASNSSRLMDQANRDKVADTNNPVNVLGLQWNTQTDTLALTSKCSIPSINSLITKRDVLKESSKVFDPLGLLSPVTVRAKIFMQSLWQRNIDWDEPLSDEDQQKWLTIAGNIQEARSLQIPRRYFPTVRVSEQPDRLHVFADASLTAYGAVAFLCSGNSTSFVMAKSRVAPLKPLTLPKLELMGALTAARLCDFIVQALHPLSLSTHLWSDSQITLHWIKGEKHVNTFVTHRVVEILNHSKPDQWRYCPTQDNPADLLTRGITSSQLKLSTLWKHGPQWLPSENSWPTWSFSPTIELQALAVTATSFSPSTTPQYAGTLHINCIIDISNYSTLSRLLAVTAYVYRFISNCKKPQQERETGSLTPSEQHHASIIWVKQCQEEVYSRELVNLTTNPAKRLPLVRQLRLFVDKDHLLRCGGRIHNAPLSETAKFPLLLPPKHWLTSLIIHSIHVQLFHAGTNATLTAIRQKFWIPTARQRIKSQLRRCVICRKHSGKPYQIPDPPPLPQIRTCASVPFTITGIDFTGALYVRSNHTEEKVYICLFTCATSRAIHLEIVTDLTVETFLLAFRRFASRRSLPQILVSDNASTYLAAADELQQLLQSERLTETLGRKGVQWKFIPKRAPWYGGWWERLIGLTKMCLKKVLGRSKISLVVLQTLIVEVEATLNDRPLTHVSSDLSDAEPLTPSHLLHGHRITPLPHEVVEGQDLTDPTYGSITDVSQRAKLQAFLFNQFQSRWKFEYLTSLREYHRTTGSNNQQIKQGDVVLMWDEAPRSTWRLAIVEKLMIGKDGLVRAAYIKTSQGRTNRPIAKLIPLEVSSPTVTETEGSTNGCQKDTINKPTVKNTADKRPRRAAAHRGRERVANWVKQLGAPPEDVMD